MLHCGLYSGAVYDKFTTMAKPRRRGRSWQIEVCINNVRDSATFDTATECREWAARKTLDAKRESSGMLPDRSLHQAFDRYAAEVSPGKRGERWERVRLAKLKRELGDMPLAAVSESDLSAWRDRALKRLKPGSVLREMNLLRSVFEVARREWRWLDRNPIADVKKPPEPPHRVRRVWPDELGAVLDCLGYSESAPVASKSQQVALAFLLAIETGMRKGELLGLTRDRVLEKRVILPMTKNGDRREVPLSPRARELLKKLDSDAELFTVGDATADVLFRRAVRRAGIVDLHFHDSRHEAATRMAKKLDVLELARVLGHRDPRSVMIYFNPTAEEMADRL